MDKALVDSGLVKSRARAKTLIEAEKVLVNGKIVADVAFTPPKDALIKLLEEDMPWVSRGALKLLGAFEEWDIDTNGRVALDVGASTGGFTEVLLSKGATKVYALDVGHDQLDQKLRNDSRVVVLEGKHVMDASPIDFPESIEFMTVDLSFISLIKVLPKLAELLAEGGDMIALVKPQFEVGKDNVDKGGIVRDPVLREEALRRVVRAAKEAGLTILGTMDSPIAGGDGNKEFLLYAVK